jgi:hypothetical protein
VYLAKAAGNQLKIIHTVVFLPPVNPCVGARSTHGTNWLVISARRKEKRIRYIEKPGSKK